MKKSSTHPCQECGAALSGEIAGKRFRGQTCRLRFNNRRLQRGAELYDLFMTMRYDRAEAKRLGVWALMCRMGQQMREEDQRDREGRQSWRKPDDVLKERPDLRAIRL